VGLRTLSLALLTLTLATACEEETPVQPTVGGASSQTASPPPATISKSLDRLGFDVIDTPRISNEGTMLPDDYSPFGNQIKLAMDADGNMHIGAPMEILFLGFSPRDVPRRNWVTVLDNAHLQDCLHPGCATQRIDPSVDDIVFSPPHSSKMVESAREDERFANEPPQTLRDAGAGDIDGDGHEDLVIVSAEDDELRLRVQNLHTAGAPGLDVPIRTPDGISLISDVRVAVANLDADPLAELVVAVTEAPGSSQKTLTSILVLDDGSTDFAELTTLDLESLDDASTQSPVLHAENVDYDVPAELVVILNESVPSGGNYNSARTRFVIFDDLLTGFAQLLADTPTIELTDFDGQITDTFVPEVLDVTIGDIDKDNINELVFGGVTKLSESSGCNQDRNGERLDMSYILAVYEFDGLGVTRTNFYDAYTPAVESSSFLPNCGQGNVPSYMRFLHTNLLDFDGDGDLEIQANRFILDTFPPLGVEWADARNSFRLDFEDFLGTEPNKTVHPGTMQVVVVDLNGDSRDELLVYRVGFDRISAHALTIPTGKNGDMTDGKLRQLAEIMVNTDSPNWGTSSAEEAINPIILPFDADGYNEGSVQTLQFVEHQLTFTEPLLLAAMAAPPCSFNIDQNIDACTTSWGQSTSTGQSEEFAISFSAGVTVGIKEEIQAGGGVGATVSATVFSFEAKLSLSTELSHIEVESYDLTKTVSFETGPMEDSVVFTSIPYDTYVYEVVSMTIDEGDAIGDVKLRQNLAMPRPPIIRLAERNYYNHNTTDSAVKVDLDVFTHKAGDIESYPTPAERDEILDLRRSQVGQARFECPGCWNPIHLPLNDLNPLRHLTPWEAFPGLFSDSVGVGQGKGSTEVEIDFSTSSSATDSLRIAAEVEVEVTIGPVLGGVAFGAAAEHASTKSIGSSTTYTGGVGSIGGDFFADHRYRYGMFTYLQTDPDGSGQEFEVINFWVE